MIFAIRCCNSNVCEVDYPNYLWEIVFITESTTFFFIVLKLSLLFISIILEYLVLRLLNPPIFFTAVYMLVPVTVW